MSRTVISLCALVLVSLSAQRAHAENYWSSVGAGCTPTDGSLDDYFIVAGSMKHQPGSTGTIKARCAVHNNAAASNPNTLHVTYRDSTGTSTPARVSATLWRQNRSNGAVAPIVTASSDSRSTTTDTQHFATFGHSLDFDRYHYYVTVDIVRSSTTQIAIFYGVSLDDRVL